MMNEVIRIEIVGFSDSACGPFPCDGDRTCGLEKCAPSESLVKAVEALKERLDYDYGNKVEVELVIIDEKIPSHIIKIIEECHPPIPIIIVNGTLLPIGKVSLPPIKEEIERRLNSN